MDLIFEQLLYVPFSNNFAATQAFNFEQVREGGRPKSGDVVLVKSQVLKSV